MPKIAIAQYRGIGVLSRGIRWFTRSKWSHTAIIIPPEHDLGKFILVEAWGLNGVIMGVDSTLIEVLSQNHTPGTQVDLFYCEVSQKDLDRGLAFLKEQIGKKYDWSLLWKFLTRGTARVVDRWICSVLGAIFFETCGNPLQRMDAWRMSPDHCGVSMTVKPWMTVYTV